MSLPATLPQRPISQPVNVDLGLVESQPVQISRDLEACLNRVEYYQPLYGITGLEPALRPCRDRACTIFQALSPIEKNFRLIDFGSSLGYFPFFFADRGATAMGYDIKPENTAVAVATQQLNGLPARFQTEALSVESVRAIPSGEYDAALILSVLHHINHARGLQYVQTLLAELLARIPQLVLELAHRGENVRYAWMNSLPANPLNILASCGPVRARLIGDSRSHLSGIPRPIYLVSK